MSPASILLLALAILLSLGAPWFAYLAFALAVVLEISAAGNRLP